MTKAQAPTAHHDAGTPHRVTPARVLRSEWHKLRALRSTWMTLIATSVLTLAMSAGISAAYDGDGGGRMDTVSPSACGQTSSPSRSPSPSGGAGHAVVRHRRRRSPPLPRPRPGDPHHHGLDLPGMRERTSLYGDTLEAGPRPHPERGWRVSLHLPEKTPQ